MKQKCTKIPFNREFQIYVIRDNTGEIEWISLYDLCRVLKRTEMYGSGQAAGLCPSCHPFPVYGNGKLYSFIRVYDVYVLLRAIRRENRSIGIVCDEIEKWVGTLSVKTHHLPVVAPDRPTVIAQPITFNFHDSPISFLNNNGKTFFNATQMARGFGKHPREWLLLSEANRFRQSLVKQGKSKSIESQIITIRGSQGATWIEESLGIEFSRWLSPEFSDWCNDRVNELVTKGYATLPRQEHKQISIKETTSHFPVPETFKEALQLAIVQQEEIERQQQKIMEDSSKVAFYDDFIESRDHFKSTIIAEELQISVLALYRFLVDEKICRYENRRYVVYPAYEPLQCDLPYYWTNKYGKTYAYSYGKRWTKSGREYILELYRKRNANY